MKMSTGKGNKNYDLLNVTTGTSSVGDDANHINEYFNEKESSSVNEEELQNYVKERKEGNR